MLRTASCVAMYVALLNAGALKAEGKVLFADDFDSHPTGAPPAGWTEHYNDARGKDYTREEAAALGVTQHVTDPAFHCGESRKSLHFLDSSHALGSGLTHSFESSWHVVLEYYMLNNAADVEGAQVFLIGDGIGSGIDYSAFFHKDGFIRIIGHDNEVNPVLVDFHPVMPYEKDTWYYVRREVDGRAGTGELYVEQVDDPSNNRTYVIGPGLSNTAFDEVGMGTSVINHTDCYVDELSVSAVPEPSTLVLLSMGALAFVVCASRWRGTT